MEGPRENSKRTRKKKLGRSTNEFEKRRRLRNSVDQMAENMQSFQDLINIQIPNYHLVATLPFFPTS
jgi:hypothetical protein